MNIKEESALILNDVMSKWNELFDKAAIPDLLYHYTSFDGLNGILKDNALRASFSQTLNDGSEWEFGRSVVQKYPIPSKTAQALFPPSSWTVPAPTSMFVTCFCEEPNLLSMWCAYTAQGGGFCLGFDGQALNGGLQRDKLVPGAFAARLVRVYYGEEPPAKMESLLQGGGHSTAQWVLENMIKAPGFYEEKEWRIIVPNPPADLMAFYSGQATVKAFVQIKSQSGKLPLKKLIYGPTLRDDKALKQSLEWMLQKYEYEGVEVVPSGIPYRL
jgi:hypothetical protein